MTLNYKILLPGCHSRESGNPDPLALHVKRTWIPAFAGMTEKRVYYIFLFSIGMRATGLRVRGIIYGPIKLSAMTLSILNKAAIKNIFRNPTSPSKIPPSAPPSAAPPPNDKLDRTDHSNPSLPLSMWRVKIA